MDCSISDDEYRLVLDEVEKYHSMKQLHQKCAPATGSITDEEKKRVDQMGMRQSMCLIHKKIAVLDSP